MIAHTVFDEDSHVVDMSDGATGYRQVLAGIDYQFWVNHQEKEWTKPMDVPFNLETGETRHTLISTNMIDGSWHKVKEQIPPRHRGANNGWDPIEDEICAVSTMAQNDTWRRQVASVL